MRPLAAGAGHDARADASGRSAPRRPRPGRRPRGPAQERDAGYAQGQDARRHHRHHHADLQVEQRARRRHVGVARLQGRRGALREEAHHRALVEVHRGAAPERRPHLEGPRQKRRRQRRRVEQEPQVQGRGGQLREGHYRIRLSRAHVSRRRYYRRGRAHHRPDRPVRHRRQRSCPDDHQHRSLGHSGQRRGPRLQRSGHPHGHGRRRFHPVLRGHGDGRLQPGHQVPRHSQRLWPGGRNRGDDQRAARGCERQRGRHSGHRRHLDEVERIWSVWPAPRASPPVAS